MTTIDGMKYAIKVIKKAPPDRILFWASIPCTGGSTWQYVNMANYRRRTTRKPLNVYENCGGPIENFGEI
eukprot:10433069-Prorocentrum_lima.AAC.1